MKKEMIKERNCLPLLTASAGNLIWGFSNVFTQVALTVASPFVVLAIRFILAVLVMCIVILTGREKVDFHKPNLGGLLSLGLVELLYFYCESYGIVYTNVTCSGVVLAVSPIVAMIMAATLLKEVPTKRQVLFSLVAVAGVIMITVTEGLMGEIQFKGICLLLGGCFFSSLFRILNRSICGIYSAFERTYVVLLISAVSFGVMGLLGAGGNLRVFVEPLVNARFLFSVTVLGICSSVGANLLVNYAAGRLPVVQVAVFGSISTICSMMGGILFLNEPVTFLSAIGAVLIFTGIWQVNHSSI